MGIHAWGLCGSQRSFPVCFGSQLPVSVVIGSWGYKSDGVMVCSLFSCHFEIYISGQKERDKSMEQVV